jgi:hypothetical protein
MTETNAQTEAAARYWTPAHMAASQPDTQSASNAKASDEVNTEADGVTIKSSVACIPASTAATFTSAVAATSAEKPATRGITSGYRTIGKFYFRVHHLGGFLNDNCTATVINDPQNSSARALVLTAGHCLVGDWHSIISSTDDWEFAPGGYGNQFPYGVWQVKAAYYPGNWYHCNFFGEDCLHGEYDFAAFIVKPIDGYGVGAYTGEDGWRANMPRTEKVTIFGSPKGSAKMLVNTTVSKTVTTDGYLDRVAPTPGFSDGASGGPWFYSYSFTSQLGDILGDTGGYDAGGPTDSPSYSPFWQNYFGDFIYAVGTHE